MLDESDNRFSGPPATPNYPQHFDAWRAVGGWTIVLSIALVVTLAVKVIAG